MICLRVSANIYIVMTCVTIISFGFLLQLVAPCAVWPVVSRHRRIIGGTDGNVPVAPRPYRTAPGLVLLVAVQK